MEEATRLFAAARTAGGCTQAEAAELSGVSYQSYRYREANPGEFRLKELKRLADDYGESARDILMRGVQAYFFTEDI